jgi:kumamolisin
LHAPAAIAHIVRGVFGLDEWPREHGMRPKTEPTLPEHNPSKKMQPFSAAQLEKMYDLPHGDGAGQVIGILQFGGTFEADDFAACMQWQGVPLPAVTPKRVDEAASKHELQSSFDTELALDTQIAGALAPGARLVLYSAPHSERGFLDALAAAIFEGADRPDVFSISFGWAEPYWTSSAIALVDDLLACAALVGMSVFCASGDDGAETSITGKPLVLAPASSPFAHACGGTSLEDANGSPAAEHAWESTGGGFSAHFAAPSWQTAALAEAKRLGVEGGRGLPDVVAQVQPGFRVVIGGQRKAAGGTSAVAPFWAALTARFNQKLGKASGFYAPLLYSGATETALFAEVVLGDNGQYKAHAGWNPCTGLGTPKGTGILSALERTN